MPDVLDFESVREDYPDRWERAQNAIQAGAMIERTAWDRWKVWLPDGAEPHEVELYRENGAFLGSCDPSKDPDDRCKGYRHHDGPCAHLCVVRIADFANESDLRNVTDTDGNSVRILDREQEQADQVDTAPPIEPPSKEPIADGGLQQ